MLVPGIPCDETAAGRTVKHSPFFRLLAPGVMQGTASSGKKTLHTSWS